MHLVAECEKIMVSRSLSKSYALAGLRFGYIVAQPQIIEQLTKVKDSYNLDRLSLVAATAALQDIPWMRRNVRRIQQSRRQLSAELRKMGFYVYPSHANFVMARKQDQNLNAVYAKLKRKQILVRYFDIPGLQDCLRITVGTPQEIRVLLKELKAIGNNPTNELFC
jgi:histidinol-phosphate aminotransferase